MCIKREETICFTERFVLARKSCKKINNKKRIHKTKVDMQIFTYGWVRRFWTVGRPFLHASVVSTDSNTDPVTHINDKFHFDLTYMQ